MPKRDAYGFTIVELIIVIAVIAILATISTVAYSGAQARSRAAAHQSAASDAVDQITVHALGTVNQQASLTKSSLVGYKEGAGDIPLLTPLTGTPDITIYVVYQITSTAGAYQAMVVLTPDINGSHRFQMDSDSAGSTGMRYRIDTSAQVNAVHSTAGYRVPGNTIIGWLQVSNNATARAYGYNQAASLNNATLLAHAGWNFTGVSLRDVSTLGVGKVVLVFNAAHDQATRGAVIDWLAEKYGVTL